MFNVGIAILFGMKQCQMDQYSQVVSKLGVASSTVSCWVNGTQVPTLYMLTCLATLFKVKLSTFILWGESNLDVELLKEEVLRWQR